jgi:hypothetical protein|tara:strand:+ start:7916 stop:8230 length:315 start_codon:yes stop_codon:yes gene_type:complete
MDEKNGFEHIDSRGVEADTPVLPGIEDEEELEDALECLPFYDALAQVIEQDVAMARVGWEYGVYVWVNNEYIYELERLLVKECAVYTPTQEDMFADDWLVVVEL